MEHDSKAYLFDIQQACEDIIEFTKNVTFSQYKQNKMIKAAVERKFLVVGEAMARIRREVPDLLAKISHPEKIIGFRNVLVHGYDIVDDIIVWSAITEHIPRLLHEIGNINCGNTSSSS